jgi:hypothetical protein
VSFPSGTSYTINEADKIQAPAFMVCPAPSTRACVAQADDGLFLNFTAVEVTLSDVVNYAPYARMIIKNVYGDNGEIIYFLGGEYFHILCPYAKIPGI